MKTVMRKTPKKLIQEVALLRSSIIGLIGKDPEGEYRSDFAHKMLHATEEKPQRHFSNTKTLLANIEEPSDV